MLAFFKLAESTNIVKEAILLSNDYTNALFFYINNKLIFTHKFYIHIDLIINAVFW